VKTHDYVHYYRGYWSEGGRCQIRIYQTDSDVPVVICSQLPENKNTSVTNMAEYLAAEMIEEHRLPTPLTWIEHYLGGVWRCRVGSPNWSPLWPEAVEELLKQQMKSRVLSYAKSLLIPDCWK
jgi:hypothetical protein